MAASLIEPCNVPVWVLLPTGLPIPADDPRAAGAAYWCRAGDPTWTFGPVPGTVARPAKGPAGRCAAGPMLIAGTDRTTKGDAA